MKLKILTENTVFQSQMKAELGFSLLIESDDKRKFLFDTGQTDLYAFNAAIGGVDISEIEAVIISHGHYDHTGGLAHFLAHNDHAPIYAKLGFEKERFGRGDRSIGLPIGTNIDPRRVHTVQEITEIAEGIFIVPEVKIYDRQETHFSNMVIRRGGESFEDQFDDEQFICVRHEGKISIISGCAHRGIVNTIRSAKEHFSEPIRLVIGGFHTLHESSEKIAQLATLLNQHEIEEVVACHCTGIEQYALLKQDYKGKIAYGHVGMNCFI